MIVMQCLVVLFGLLLLAMAGITLWVTIRLSIAKLDLVRKRSDLHNATANNNSSEQLFKLHRDMYEERITHLRQALIAARDDTSENATRDNIRAALQADTDKQDAQESDGIPF